MTILVLLPHPVYQSVFQRDCCPEVSRNFNKRTKISNIIARKELNLNKIFRDIETINTRICAFKSCVFLSFLISPFSHREKDTSLLRGISIHQGGARSSLFGNTTWAGRKSRDRRVNAKEPAGGCKGHRGRGEEAKDAIESRIIRAAGKVFFPAELQKSPH